MVQDTSHLKASYGGAAECCVSAAVGETPLGVVEGRRCSRPPISQGEAVCPLSCARNSLATNFVALIRAGRPELQVELSTSDRITDLLVEVQMGQPHASFVDVLSSLQSHVCPAKSTKHGVHKPKRIPLNAESSDRLGARQCRRFPAHLRSSAATVRLEIVIQQSRVVRVTTPETDGTLINESSRSALPLRTRRARSKRSDHCPVVLCTGGHRHMSGVGFLFVPATSVDSDHLRGSRVGEVNTTG